MPVRPLPLVVVVALAACKGAPTDSDTDTDCPAAPATPNLLPEDEPACTPADPVTEVRFIGVDVRDGGVRETATFRTPPGASPHRLTLTTEAVRAADGEVLAQVFADLGEGDSRANGLITGDGAVSLVFEARPDTELTLGVDLDITTAGLELPVLGAGFTVEITTLPDCHEPNDSPAAATPIPTNQEVRAWYTRGETPDPAAIVDDWYGFRADGVSAYTVAWGDLPTGHAIGVSVRDAADVELAGAATWDGQTGPLELGVLPEGPIRVGFVPFVGSAASCGMDGGIVPPECGAVLGPYWLRVDRVAPAPDPEDACDPGPSPIVPDPPPPMPAPEPAPATGMPPGVSDPSEVDPFGADPVADLADPGPTWRGPYLVGVSLATDPSPACGGRMQATWDAARPVPLQASTLDTCAFAATPAGIVRGVISLEATPDADGLLRGTARWDEEPADGVFEGEGAFTGRFGVDENGAAVLVGAADLVMEVEVFGTPVSVLQELRVALNPYTPPAPPPIPQPLPAGVDGLWRFELASLYPGDQPWSSAWSVLDADGSPILTPVLDGYAEALRFGSTASADVQVRGGVADGDQLELTVASRGSGAGYEGTQDVLVTVGPSAMETVEPTVTVQAFYFFGSYLFDTVALRGTRVGAPVPPAEGFWAGELEVLDAAGGVACAAFASASVDAAGVVGIEVQPCNLPTGALPGQGVATQIPESYWVADLGVAPVSRALPGAAPYDDLVTWSVVDGVPVIGATGRYSVSPGSPSVPVRLRLTAP